MKRIHFFELCDQAWFPAVFRDAATEYLQTSLRFSGQAQFLFPKLAAALRDAGVDRIVDLCSGSGGPVPLAIEGLPEHGVSARATLTDGFPNLAAFEHVAAASSGRIDFVPEPVEVTEVPKQLEGLRTLFNAFHHFRPETARTILRNAVRDRSPIAIFELVGRDPVMLIGILFAWLGVLLVMPFVRPVRWSWLFFTYVVPVVPLLVVFDGFVSCLRVYSVPELEALVSEVRAEATGYRFEVGRIRIGRTPAHATYLIGIPAFPAGSEPASESADA
ncbi:MAG: class I SAM-dependent methyltransferase [Myxococcales bacterium]|nr:class I SAM-dependent methyltransferase [Myxococcales bacterium]